MFGVELRGFWCGTKGVELKVFGLKLRGFRMDQRVFGVELRGFWRRTEGLCGLKRSYPFVWN